MSNDTADGDSFDVQLRKQTTSWQEKAFESKANDVTTEEERTVKVAWENTVSGRGEQGIFSVATHYVITENFSALRHFSKSETSRDPSPHPMSPAQRRT